MTSMRMRIPCCASLVGFWIGGEGGGDGVG